MLRTTVGDSVIVKALDGESDYLAEIEKIRHRKVGQYIERTEFLARWLVYLILMFVALSFILACLLSFVHTYIHNLKIYTAVPKPARHYFGTDFGKGLPLAGIIGPRKLFLADYRSTLNQKFLSRMTKTGV